MSMDIVSTYRTGGEEDTMLSVESVLQVPHVNLGIPQPLHDRSVLIHHEVLGVANLSSKSGDTIQDTTVVRQLYHLAVHKTGHRASKYQTPNFARFSWPTSKVPGSSWCIDCDWSK